MKKNEDFENLENYVQIRKFVESPEFKDFHMISPRSKQITLMRVVEGKTYQEIGKELRRTAPIIRKIFLKAKKRIESQIGFLSKKSDIYSVFIDECPLSVRAKNVLYQANVLTIHDLCCLSTGELANAPLFGKETRDEIYIFLKILKIEHNLFENKSYEELKNLVTIPAKLQS